MTTSGERIAKVEGVLEQINTRLSHLEHLSVTILEQKADKNEVRLLFGASIALLAGIISLMGVVLSKI